LGRWLFGCDICQLVCPYNQRPPESQWPEFSASSGVGHYVDLLDLLLIPDQEKFHQRFIASAVRRPKRRGFLRNALVVLGNSLRDDATTCEDSEKILTAITKFAEAETDELLLEHAIWALSQSPGAGRGHVQAFAARIKDKDRQEQIARYAR
jgi:epoxyqueuosine reductase